MKPARLKPKIVFEDTHLIVLSKPAGLLSQGDSSGEENLVDWLRDYLGRNYVGLIHRLDRNVSGLMVIAKRTKAASRLTKALQEGRLVRWYLGIIIGKLTHAAVWEHYLQKNEETNEVKIVSSKSAKAKLARLQVTPRSFGKYKGRSVTLAEFELETGRSHQIRVQSAEKGFPLLGDAKYGKKTTGNENRLFLHSYKIEFPHPMMEEIMRFEENVPKEMRHAVGLTAGI